MIVFDILSQQNLPILHPCMRDYSSVHTQQPADPVRDIDIDPYIMLDDDIKYVTQDIRDVSWLTKRIIDSVSIQFDIH